MRILFKASYGTSNQTGKHSIAHTEIDGESRPVMALNSRRIHHFLFFKQSEHIWQTEVEGKEGKNKHKIEIIFFLQI